MFTLEISKNKLNLDEEVVEIRKEGRLIGTIYQTKKGIKIVSKYFPRNCEDVVTISKIPPRAISVDLI